MNEENQMPVMPDETASQDTDPLSELSRMFTLNNIAEDLDDDRLNEIGNWAKEGFELDLDSRREWEDQAEEWTRLAMQCREERTYPWPQASNVKYPLLSTAAMQFAARAYPALVPSNGKIVMPRVVGKDPDGQKRNKADRIAMYMSYQLMCEMEGWEEGMDKLLIMVPIVGTMFKKTYFDPIEGINKSELVLPKNLVVNYWTKNLKTCERVSEIIQLNEREFQEKVRAEIFLDVDLGEPQVQESDLEREYVPPDADSTTPYIFIEQHTYYDLDDDGYPEPYVITFHKDSGKVVRIVPRYQIEDVVTKEKKILRIKPCNYYTKFGFIPNPDGSFYDIGFGVLLGPINESVNTLINQLIDAGSLSNLQAGFIGKGLKIKMGDAKFTPGEWKAVNATGDDIKKQIFPLPVREPSMVLFQLMGSLITSGKELASVAEIFVGKSPGQNTPATTTMATIEQGMKVFTAVYKRLYRALADEFEKLYKLNGLFMNPQTYATVIDQEVGPDDFDGSNYDMIPAADPNSVSQTEKLMKAQGLMELLPLGTINPMAATLRILEAQEQVNPQELMMQPQPQQDPKLQEMQMKMQLDQQAGQQKMQESQFNMELKARDSATQLAMKQAAQAQEMDHKERMGQLEAAQTLHKGRIFAAEAQAKAVQNVVHGEVQHRQSMEQAKEKAKLQNQTSSTGGKNTSQKPSSKK